MNPPDKGSFVGRSLPRREDHRLLTGRGQFIADLDLPHMLHAVFVRSPLAHARIRAVDLSRAACAPGVSCVLSGADLLQLLPPVPDTQLALPSKWTATSGMPRLGRRYAPTLSPLVNGGPPQHDTLRLDSCLKPDAFFFST